MPSPLLRFGSFHFSRSIFAICLPIFAGVPAASAGSFIPAKWERIPPATPISLPSFRAVNDPALAGVAANITAAPPYTFLTPPHRIIRDYSLRTGFPFPNTYGALSYGDMDPTRKATGLDFTTKLNFNRGDSTDPPNLVWGFHWGPDQAELGFIPTTDTSALGIHVTIGAVPGGTIPGITSYPVRVRVNGTGGYTASSNGFLVTDQPAGLMNDAPENAPDGSLSVRISTRANGDLVVSTEYLNASGDPTSVSSNLQFFYTALGNTLNDTGGWRAVTGSRSLAGNFHTCTMQDTAGGTEVASAAPYAATGAEAGAYILNSQYGFDQRLGDAVFLPADSPPSVQIVPDAPNRKGQLLFAPGLQDMSPTRLTALVRLTAAGAPADGFAINFGEYGTDASAFDEEGAPYGLVYSFDLFQNTENGEPAPGITCRYNGAQVGYTAVTPGTLLAGGAFRTLEASLDPADPWVIWNGVRYAFGSATLLPGPVLSPSHGVVVVSARTGGLSCSVSVASLKVHATNYVKPQISLDGQTLSQTGRLDYSTTMAPGSWSFTRSAFSSFPIRSLGHTTENGRIFYRAVSLGRPLPARN